MKMRTRLLFVFVASLLFIAGLFIPAERSMFRTHYPYIPGKINGIPQNTDVWLPEKAIENVIKNKQNVRPSNITFYVYGPDIEGKPFHGEIVCTGGSASPSSFDLKKSKRKISGNEMEITYTPDSTYTKDSSCEVIMTGNCPGKTKNPVAKRSKRGMPGHMVDRIFLQEYLIARMQRKL